MAAEHVPLTEIMGSDREDQYSHEYPLHFACKEGSLDDVQCIIEHLDKQTLSDCLHRQNETYGNTPLHLAVQFGHVEIVEYIFSIVGECLFTHLLQLKNKAYDTPVHYAARRGCLRTLKLMYETDKECLTFRGSLKQAPIHCACSFGNIETVQFLLKKNLRNHLKVSTIPLDIDPFEKTTECPQPIETEEILKEHSKCIEIQASRTDNNQTEEQWTPLTCACRFGNKEVVRYLLSVGAKPYPVALQKAIEGGNEECAKLLLLVDDPNRDNYWREILRPYTPDGKTKPTTPFRELIKLMPDVAEVVLHNCTRLDRHLVNKENFEVECNFDFVCDSINIDDSQSDLELQYLEHPVSLMVKYKRKELLTHPVVSSYIYDQWKFFGWWCSLLNLFLYIFFQAILFTTITFLLPHPLGADCNTFNESDNWSTLNMSMNTSTDNINDNKSSIGQIIIALPILVHSLIRLIVELMQLIWSVIDAVQETSNDKDYCRFIVRVDYIKSWMNWIEFPLYTLTVVFILTLLVQLANNNPCPLEWQWQIGAFVMLLTWFELIVFFSQFQLVGVYALMFIKVLYTFMKVAILAFLMILAFTMTFYMLLSQPGYTNSPFMTVGRAILKIMVMSTGELNSDSFFRYQDGADISGLPFPAVTVILWLFFFILMTVLLTNMLIGLAVGDIRAVYEEAEFEKLYLEVEYILGIGEKLRAIPFLNRSKRLVNKLTMDGKKFMPNAKKSTWDEIMEFLITSCWGVIPYDSREGLDWVISYYSKKNKPIRVHAEKKRRSQRKIRLLKHHRMTKAQPIIDNEAQQAHRESKQQCIIQ